MILPEPAMRSWAASHAVSAAPAHHPFSIDERNEASDPGLVAAVAIKLLLQPALFAPRLHVKLYEERGGRDQRSHACPEQAIAKCEQGQAGVDRMSDDRVH